MHSLWDVCSPPEPPAPREAAPYKPPALWPLPPPSPWPSSHSSPRPLPSPLLSPRSLLPLALPALPIFPWPSTPSLYCLLLSLPPPPHWSITSLTLEGTRLPYPSPGIASSPPNVRFFTLHPPMKYSISSQTLLFSSPCFLPIVGKSNLFLFRTTKCDSFRSRE